MAKLSVPERGFLICLAAGVVMFVSVVIYAIATQMTVHTNRVGVKWVETHFGIQQVTNDQIKGMRYGLIWSDIPEGYEVVQGTLIPKALANQIREEVRRCYFQTAAAR